MMMNSPIEQRSTGSPASMLSSGSSNSDSAKQVQAGNYHGGNSGIHGDVAISHGTSSSGSYGASGQSHSEASSSANSSPGSGSGYAGFGPSSGYGSGISTFGASVAFSDYPTGQSTASGQPTYGAQSQQHSTKSIGSSSSSNSNSNYNHQQSQSPAELYANQKLRQAKKTIIPIVVQVEHAILENNGAALANNHQQQQHQQQQGRGNKYGGARSLRQLAGGKRNRNKQHSNGYGNNQVPYGAATNEIGINHEMNMGNSQYINAANAQDINQITAAINAENAASAAAALAQADMAFGNGSPAYIPGLNNQPRQPNGGHQANVRPGSGYANAMQTAASALLANPVIQAAASGGLASVSKLGAKLGEFIALPSMQMPSTIQALPSALSSITNQMSAQLNQAVQQVAKEHPSAHAFARQVAQHAGIQLPTFNSANNLQQGQQQQNGQQAEQGNNFQQQVSASNQHSQSISPQAQLQNLKLSIGQNLQTAASQLIGINQKVNAQSAASLLANPLSALYPPSVNAALKQLSAGIIGQASGVSQAVNGNSNNNLGSQNSAHDSHHAQSSSIVPVQQQLNSAQQQQLQQLSQQLAAASDLHSATSQAFAGSSDSWSANKPTKSTLKSKFLSFFQPPKFVSNLLSWNDRADDRNDQGVVEEQKKSESTTTASNNNTSTLAVGANKTSESELKPKVATPVALPTTNSTKLEKPEVVKVEVGAKANSTSS